MYAVSVNKKQLKKTLTIIIAVAVLGAAAVVVGGRLLGHKSDAGDETVKAETAAQREEYLASMGLEYMQASSLTEVTVPEEFDDRFEEYNAMLKTTGFDLAPLKGDSVQKCTYVITNRSDLGDNVSAVLLVKDGELVAAHLINSDDGKFYPINKPLPDAQQTILPTEDEDTAAEPVSENSYPTD